MRQSYIRCTRYFSFCLRSLKTRLGFVGQRSFCVSRAPLRGALRGALLLARCLRRARLPWAWPCPCGLGCCLCPWA